VALGNQLEERCLEMWVYQKTLEYPARVRTTNPRLARDVITQYGGPDFTFFSLHFEPDISDVVALVQVDGLKSSCHKFDFFFIRQVMDIV